MNRQKQYLDLYARLSHFAIWPTLYALGIYLFLTQSLPGEHRFESLPALFIALCTHACYMLDRIKVSDNRIDQADAIALPGRAQSLFRHAHVLRRTIIAQLLAASVIGFMLHPMLTIIPLISLIAIHGYAGRTADPSKPRLKDLPACKPFFIATSHIALGVVVIWASAQSSQKISTLIEQAPTTLLVNISLWLIVVGDAMLCDIDDLETDRLFSTRSFAVLFGNQRAWIIALACVSIGAALLGFTSAPARLAAFALVASTLLTKNNTNHRDFIDARLLPIALLSLITL